MVGLRAPWGVEGGVERCVAELGPRLARLGCAVTVYCRDRYNTLGPGMHQGLRLLNVPTYYSRSAEALLHTAICAPQAALEADLVHFHAAGPSLLSWLPRLAGRAVVATLHGLDWERDKWGPVARRVLRAGGAASARWPHRVITVGEHLQRWYADQEGIRTELVPNGVAPIPALPLERAGLPGLRSGDFFLYLGRIVPEKRLDLLLRAQVRSGLPLVIVGGSTHMDTYLASLRQMAHPSVIFAGPLYGEARDALLGHCRALVLPSSLEGSPLAPLEALSAGRPVLLSDIPPHRELLGQSSFGELVPDSGWAQALQHWSELPASELTRRGESGRRHVQAHHSWDQAAERTLAVYRQALAQLRP
jgi:glycosyltransferase involved in cell wall biosynthesis